MTLFGVVIKGIVRPWQPFREFQKADPIPDRPMMANEFWAFRKKIPAVLSICRIPKEDEKPLANYGTFKPRYSTLGTRTKIVMYYSDYDRINLKNYLPKQLRV